MTESDDEPIVEETLVESVHETARKPDSSSKYLESFTSDLLIVDDAGQKDNRNKSDLEEKTSLSLGERIGHTVVKESQKVFVESIYVSCLSFTAKWMGFRNIYPLSE